MIKTYNKLIRDNIPQIIENSGSKYNIKTLNKEDYTKCLNQKLLEECNEWIEDDDMSEIADILEVLHAIADNKGFLWEEIEALRLKKKEERGGFAKRIFLEDVYIEDVYTEEEN